VAVAAAASVTVELISPDAAYRLYAAVIRLSG
jgi:hypothetical protein